LARIVFARATALWRLTAALLGANVLADAAWRNADALSILGAATRPPRKAPARAKE